MSLAAIQNEIQGLTPEEPEIKRRETAWATESERRIDAIEQGKLGVRDAKDVVVDLRNSFRN
jgi:hypothetical protein